MKIWSLFILHVLTLCPILAEGNSTFQTDKKAELSLLGIVVDSIQTQIIEGKPCCTIFLDVQKNISCQIGFRILGCLYEDGSYSSYPLLIDGVCVQDKVVAIAAEWHDVGTEGKAAFFFSKGKHLITLMGEGDDVPNIEQLYCLYNSTLYYSQDKSLNLPNDQATTNRDSRHISYQENADSVSPCYHFQAEIDKPVNYTFFVKKYFTKGQTVNIRTDTIGNTHHNVYLYHEWHPGSCSYVTTSLTSLGGHAMINLVAPQTGFYYLLVTTRENNTNGRCNVTVNNTTYQNVMISNTSLVINHATAGQQYASFALNNSGNPIMWLISGTSNNVKAWNDDYSYNSSTSDFNWGSSARIDGILNNGDRILVSSKNSNVSIITDIYAGCKKVKSDSQFINEASLKSADVLASGGKDTNYNCIAWSVGEWTTYHEPGGLYIGSQTYEDFYAQYGLAPIGATESNSVVDLWGSVLPNGRKYLLHASVKAKSNPYSTGYDWESKAGAGNTYRIFHPRYSMKASYGEVLFHLRKDPSLNTLQYPVDYRVLAFASYNQSEKEQIRMGVNHISKQNLQDFTELFCRCEIAGKSIVNATVDNYELVKEYQDIFSLCDNEPELQYVLFQKLEDRSLLALKLLKDVVVLHNIDLARDVLLQAEQNKWSDDGKRIIRPIFTDAILFTKALLAQLRGENSYEDELVLSNSSRYDIQVKDHQTTVRLAMSESSNVSIVCADLNGSEINYILRNKVLPEGSQYITFPMQRSGMYVVSVIIDGIVYERKINIK